MAPWALDDATYPTAMAVLATVAITGAVAMAARALLIVALTMRAIDGLKASAAPQNTSEIRRSKRR